jgi:hypothetical protein
MWGEIRPRASSLSGMLITWGRRDLGGVVDRPNRPHGWNGQSRRLQSGGEVMRIWDSDAD